MTREKSIVIGCDDTAVLPTVLNSLKERSSFPITILSAARIVDLIGIVKSLTPDLVILCFRNNQNTLNNFNTFVKKPEIPILCLTKKNEYESLRWNKNNIVFNYPIEH